LKIILNNNQEIDYQVDPLVICKLKAGIHLEEAMNLISSEDSFLSILHMLSIKKHIHLNLMINNVIINIRTVRLINFLFKFQRGDILKQIIQMPSMLSLSKDGWLLSDRNNDTVIILDSNAPLNAIESVFKNESFGKIVQSLDFESEGKEDRDRYFLNLFFFEQIKSTELKKKEKANLDHLFKDLDFNLAMTQRRSSYETARTLTKERLIHLLQLVFPSSGAPIYPSAGGVYELYPLLENGSYQLNKENLQIIKKHPTDFQLFKEQKIRMIIFIISDYIKLKIKYQDLSLKLTYQNSGVVLSYIYLTATTLGMRCTAYGGSAARRIIDLPRDHFEVGCFCIF
jgi:hypothetical protein